jgi:hypothetical protein
MTVLDSFPHPRYNPPMSDLTPASPDDIANALSFALRFNGRKRVHDADLVMSRIVAERLVAHLLRSGFVLMRQPPAEMATTAGLPMGRDDGEG